MKNLKRISITTLIAIMILGTTAFAVTGIVNAPNGLVFRKDADKSAEPLATVPDEANVEIIEKSGDWYKAKYNEQEGYLFKEYVKPDDEVKKQEEQEKTNTIEPSETQIYPKGKLKIYILPLITSTVINQVDESAQIKVEKQITNWSYISVGDIKGWVRTYGIQNEVQTPETTPVEPEEKQENNSVEISNLQEEPKKQEEQVITPADNSNSTEETTEISKGVIDVDYANIRKQASTDAEIVTTLTKETTFTVLAQTSEWYKIKYTSPDSTIYEGYVFKQLVKPINN